jgi:flagellar motor switch protein FliG
MLTLCGLPVEVSEAALSMLPRAQAKQARARMNSLGSLQLREIDRAKASVAEASMSLLLSPALSISRAA